MHTAEPATPVVAPASTRPAAAVPAWGLGPTAPAALSWGARAIAETGTRPVLTPTGRPKVKNGRPVRDSVALVALLPDRQECTAVPGTPIAARDAFVRLLNETGIPHIRAEVARLGHAFFEVGQDWNRAGLSIRVRSSGRGGYLYLNASIPQGPDHETLTAAKWSGAGPIPEIGTRVQVRMNGFGPGVVLGHGIEHGYAYVLVLPDTQPEGGLALVHVFGAELA